MVSVISYHPPFQDLFLALSEQTRSFARRLWNNFRSLACRFIRAGKTLTDHSLDLVMQTIDRQVEQFLEASLQLDVLSLEFDDDPAVLSG